MDKALLISILARRNKVQLIYRLYFIEKSTFRILTCSIHNVTKDKIHLFNYLNANAGSDNVISILLPINV
jgi:hypothetical protein